MTGRSIGVDLKRRETSSNGDRNLSLARLCVCDCLTIFSRRVDGETPCQSPRNNTISPVSMHAAAASRRVYSAPQAPSAACATLIHTVLVHCPSFIAPRLDTAANCIVCSAHAADRAPYTAISSASCAGAAASLRSRPPSVPHPASPTTLSPARATAAGARRRAGVHAGPRGGTLSLSLSLRWVFSSAEGCR
jgi:hypothetical protein